MRAPSGTLFFHFAKGSSLGTQMLFELLKREVRDQPRRRTTSYLLPQQKKTIQKKDHYFLHRFFVRFSGFGRDFWRFLGEIWDLDVNLRRPRTTSGGEISVRGSPNTFPPSEKIRFPIPILGKIPGCFPQNSHIYNGIPIPRPFLYYFFTF